VMFVLEQNTALVGVSQPPAPPVFTQPRPTPRGV
jgi:hypothetical protein